MQPCLESEDTCHAGWQPCTGSKACKTATDCTCGLALLHFLKGSGASSNTHKESLHSYSLALVGFMTPLHLQGNCQTACAWASKCSSSSELEPAQDSYIGSECWLTGRTVAPAAADLPG